LFLLLGHFDEFAQCVEYISCGILNLSQQIVQLLCFFFDEVLDGPTFPSDTDSVFLFKWLMTDAFLEIMF
jgi:hypothetical protein